MLARQHGQLTFPFRQAKEGQRVVLPGLPGLARLGEAPGGVLADRLQQPVPRPASGYLSQDEGFAGQPVNDVERGGGVPASAHGGRRGQAETPGNTDSSRKTRASAADSSS